MAGRAAARIMPSPSRTIPMSFSGGGLPTDIDCVLTELRIAKCRNQSVTAQCAPGRRHIVQPRPGEHAGTDGTHHRQAPEQNTEF